MTAVAVILAAIVAFAIGAAWYWALGSRWAAAQGWSAADVTGAAVPPVGPLITSFVAELVMAGVLLSVTRVMTAGLVTVAAGVTVGALAWLGFVATTISVNYAYARKSVRLTIIDAAHWLLVCVAEGIVIGWFG